MRFLAAVGLGLLFTANVVWAGTAGPPPPCSPLYQEAGDAGDRFNPQNVSGGPFCGFSGTIGADRIGGLQPEAVDDVDAFKFYFAGGVFEARLVFPAPGGGQEGDLNMRLYSASDLNLDIDATLGSDLAAGLYVIELSFNGEDPPFTIDLIGPDILLPILAPLAVPAPGVLALLLAGLAGLGAQRRRRTAS